MKRSELRNHAKRIEKKFEKLLAANIGNTLELEFAGETFTLAIRSLQNIFTANKINSDSYSVMANGVFRSTKEGDSKNDEEFWGYCLSESNYQEVEELIDSAKVIKSKLATC